MKKLLLILVISLFTFTSISGQVVKENHPFDHSKINPHMNDYCYSCHVCDNPTRFNPCLEQCARHGAQFKSDLTYDKGPDVVIIDKLSKLYGPVIFSHKLHASMSEMGEGCTLCHHYSEDTGDIPACSECHKNKSDLTDLSKPSLKGSYHRQCLGCHKEWSHENACQFCHEEINASDAETSNIDKTDIVGVPHPLISAEEKYVYKTKYKEGPIVTFHHTDHADIFNLSCSACHKGDTCYRCHNIDKPKESESIIKHEITCFSCHNENNCSFCHSTEEKPPFSHDISTGFALGQYHQDVDCNKCHRSVSNFVTPSTNCTDCHIHWDVGTFDHSVTGLTLNEYHMEEDCEVCHMDRDFRIEPTCDNCHDEITYPDELPGIKK